jgi:hypothetical protein
VLIVNEQVIFKELRLKRGISVISQLQHCLSTSNSKLDRDELSTPHPIPRTPPEWKTEQRQHAILVSTLTPGNQKFDDG